MPRGTHGTAHPRAPLTFLCQPSACQHVQLPALSVEAALAPTQPRKNPNTFSPSGDFSSQQKGKMIS